MSHCNLASRLGQDWISSCVSSYQQHLGRVCSVTAYATITWILLSYSRALFMRLRKAIKKPTIIRGVTEYPQEPPWVTKMTNVYPARAVLHSFGFSNSKWTFRASWPCEAKPWVPRDHFIPFSLPLWPPHQIKSRVRASFWHIPFRKWWE